MKAKRMIIAAVVLLALVPTASAQEQIKKAFQEVTDELAGVTKVGEHNTAKVDENGIAIESKVITVKVERRYQHSVSETLKDAFRNEASKTSMYEEEAGNEKHELDSALVHDLGLRRMWSIWRDEDDAVLIGSMKNSTYFIANFNDKKHKGYRTCYAAEWSNAADPEVYTAKLVYVYGRKPESASGGKPKRSVSIMRSIRRSPSDLIEQSRQWNLPVNVSIDSLMQQQWNIPDVDSLMQQQWNTHNVDSLMRNLNPIMRQSYRLQPNTVTQDIPFDGDKDKWMALAMQRGVSGLSNGDWHRFFGLLTQKMMDKVNKESKEDLVVAANLILDLCKNALLDDDEREVVAKRLQQVAERFDSDDYSYINDMLTLAAKKVQKK